MYALRQHVIVSNVFVTAMSWRVLLCFEPQHAAHMRVLPAALEVRAGLIKGHVAP